MESVEKVYQEHKLIKGLVYCIVCNITGERYYGSTFTSINDRMYVHKSNHNTCVSKQIIDRRNYYVEVVLECYVENKRDLDKLESDFIRNNDCINQRDAYLSEDEKRKLNNSNSNNYYHQNKKEISEKRNKFYIENVERLCLISKKYRDESPTIICECGGKVKKYNVSRHYKSKKHQKYLESLNQK